MLTFAGTAGCLEETKEFVKSHLADLERATEKTYWKGLPELTNKDGEDCTDSCPVQAWSAACTLDVLYDLKHVQ